MRLRSLLGVAGLLAASYIAHADTFQTYATSGRFFESVPNDDGTYTDTYTYFTGTATFDVTTGLFTSIGVPGAGGYPVSSDCYGVEFSCADFYGEDFSFYLDDVGDASYVNGRRVETEINGTGTVGALIVPTPEPSSFALLGTGLLGVAGVIRTRFA